MWGGILRVTMVHHFTFFINSFCHFIGKRNYDSNTTARDSWIMAFLTFGEGYHNFHHKFQWDYRNGIKWYNFDPSKWIIKLLSMFNLAHNLKKASEHAIFKARLDTLNEKIKKLSSGLQTNKYQDKIVSITTNALENIHSLKRMENKYNSMKSISKRKRIFFKRKRKLYQAELQNSLSSLFLILMSLKKLS